MDRVPRRPFNQPISAPNKFEKCELWQKVRHIQKAVPHSCGHNNSFLIQEPQPNAANELIWPNWTNRYWIEDAGTAILNLAEQWDRLEILNRTSDTHICYNDHEIDLHAS